MTLWPNWQAFDTEIVLVGVLCAMACALLGNFLVLRKMSMMGDAISHAVLPGLALAFLVTGSRASVTMFVGAAIVGVLTAVFTQWVHAAGRVDQGAAMGVVFTTLFAIGLILIVRAADKVDLDAGCVLYGAIELTPLDRWTVLGIDLPRTAWVLGGTLALDALLVALFYKELKLSAFDPALATTLGIPATLMHYLLMTLVAVTTVASFEAIGSILVIAMLIVPPAAAYLLTDRLGVMIVLSLGIAAASAAIGHWSAITVPPWLGFRDTNTASMMAVAASGLFVLALLAGPRHGLVSKAAHRARLSFTILQEDVLGLVYRLEEMGLTRRTAAAPAVLHQALGVRPVLARLALRRLAAHGRLSPDPAARGAYRLTDAGRDQARRLVRAHRLWEVFLHDQLRVAPDHTHTTAERLEHLTDHALAEQLTRATGDPLRDPQGKAVPQDTPGPQGTPGAGPTPAPEPR